MKSLKAILPVFVLALTGFFFLDAHIQEAEARPSRRRTVPKKVYKKPAYKRSTPRGNAYRTFSERNRVRHRRRYRRERHHRHRPRRVYRHTRRVYTAPPVHVHTGWCGLHEVYHDPYYYDAPYWNLGINSNGNLHLGIGW